MSKKKKSGAAVGKRCIDQQRQARLLKQADMQSSIESQVQVGCEVIACFFTISGAMLEVSSLVFRLFRSRRLGINGLN